MNRGGGYSCSHAESPSVAASQMDRAALVPTVTPVDVGPGESEVRGRSSGHRGWTSSWTWYLAATSYT